MTRRRSLSCAAAFALVLGACSSGSTEGASPTTPPPTSAATTTAPPTTATSARVTVPAGVLAAVPFQNRLDVAKDIFQLKLYNGTGENLVIDAVQLVWAGMTTPLATRRNSLAAGDRIDFPVPLVPASCQGDGTAASMPDIASAVAKVTIDGGRVLDVPVYDAEGVAAKLYLDDCERQHIESMVQVEWAGLHRADFEGRPVTEGALRLTRRGATDAVEVRFVGNTINYTFQAAAATEGTVGTLPVGAATVDIPIRFVEGRCDSHALSESSEPYNFVVTLDLGDGVARTISVVPSAADQLAMRDTSLEACRVLGQIGFAGQDSGTTTTTATTATSGG